MQNQIFLEERNTSLHENSDSGKILASYRKLFLKHIYFQNILYQKMQEIPRLKIVNKGDRDGYGDSPPYLGCTYQGQEPHRPKFILVHSKGNNRKWLNDSR